MTLVKYRHRRPSLLNPFFDDFFTKDAYSHPGMKRMRVNTPSVNVTEDETKFTLHMAAPGLSKDDFNIEFENNVLSISAVVNEESEEKSPKFNLKEFSYHSFKRSFSIPENVEAEKIKASYTNGILILEMPKLEVEVSDPKKQIKVS